MKKRTSRYAAIIACILLLTTGGLSIAAEAPDGAAEARSDVLGYLDRTIGWYRSVQAMRLSPDSAQEAVILQATQRDALKILRRGFDYANAEISVLEPQQPDQDTDTNPSNSTSRLAAAQKSAQGNVAAIRQQIAATNSTEARSAAARAKLQQRKEALSGALSLSEAQIDLLNQVKDFLANPKNADRSLAGAVKVLERSFPELKPGDAAAADSPVSKAASTAGGAANNKGESVAARSTSGIIAAVSDFLPLWQRARQIDSLISQLDDLVKQNDVLRTDLRADLVAASAAGRAMTERSGVVLPPAPPDGSKPPSGDDPAPAAAKTPATLPTSDDFDALTARFKLLSAAVIPLGQQHQALETCRSELVQWRAVLTHEFASSLIRLMLRIFVLAVLILIPLALSEVSRRAANRYVKDTRRRHQLRTVRRAIVGTAIGIVLFLSLFAEVGSLATYVGLLTAGVAVALQQVILSMFAYLFFFGRFGVRVGERVTLGGVTGDVVEAGLLRVYVMEVVDGKATGRIAIFPNLVFFQASAFFKQIADTNYAWQDQSLTFAADVDQEAIRQTLLAAASPVFASYYESMKKQQAALESATNLRVAIPEPECVIQLTDAGQVATLRYPVEPGRAEQIGQQMGLSIKHALVANPGLKLAVTGPV